MTDTPNSGQAAFKPRARLLRLLGEELISDEVVAVTELVKNAHDADASTITITFDGVTSAQGSIIIRDDGHGMDLDTLLGAWLQPAFSSKARAERRTTHRGRRVLGEKGVGRFAVDKLASRLELITRAPGQDHEILAQFNWNEYDDSRLMLSDIHNPWQLRSPEVIRVHGTCLRLSGLRSRWTERAFRRLCVRLSRLVNPFQSLDDFSIEIVSTEFPQYSGTLRPEILDRAPYRIEALYDGSQAVALALNGAASSHHLWNGRGDLHCGPVRLRLFAFDLETDALAGIGPRGEVRAWLREWCGVSVYRDGFRVWPYGEPHDDWLRLDQRRVNNPVVRLSNNQIVGFIEITSDDNPELRDQTNREGLIQNPALQDLRRLVHFVLQALESERHAQRQHEKRRGPSRSSVEHVDSELFLPGFEAFARNAPPGLEDEVAELGHGLRVALRSYRSQTEHSLTGYADLAALGHAALDLSETLLPMLDVTRSECTAIRRALRGPRMTEHREQLAGLLELISLMEERVLMLAPLSDGTGRRRTLDLIAELRRSRTLLQPVLDARAVRMHLRNASESLARIEMTAADFHRLVHILVHNSIDWLEFSDDPLIRVTVQERDGRGEIVFSDNGPGIPREHAARVFEPLFSLKEGARGMGLPLARRIVEKHNGHIEVIMDRRRKGANIRITLPLRKSRSTTPKRR